MSELPTCNQSLIPLLAMSHSWKTIYQNDEHEIDTESYATRRQVCTFIVSLVWKFNKQSAFTKCYNFTICWLRSMQATKREHATTYTATDLRDHFSFFATCFPSFSFDFWCSHFKWCTAIRLIFERCGAYQREIDSCFCHFFHISATRTILLG